VSSLSFEPVDCIRFPAFQLGVEAGRAGGTATAVFNAANEVAVARFLQHEIAFTAIPRVIEAALSAHHAEAADTLERVLAADRWAREVAGQAVATAPVQL
jgi:1-deoxy-D-xylulose-5-phosphate reductoisomerase